MKSVHLLRVKPTEAAAVQLALIVNRCSRLPNDGSTVIPLQQVNKSINDFLIVIKANALHEVHAGVQNQRAVSVHV